VETLKWRKRVQDLGDAMLAVESEIGHIFQTPTGLVAWYVLDEKFLKGLADYMPGFIADHGST
jgi:hypothetical protein